MSKTNGVYKRNYTSRLTTKLSTIVTDTNASK